MNLVIPGTEDELGVRVLVHDTFHDFTLRVWNVSMAGVTTSCKTNLVDCDWSDFQILLPNQD